MTPARVLIFEGLDDEPPPKAKPKKKKRRAPLAKKRRAAPRRLPPKAKDEDDREPREGETWHNMVNGYRYRYSRKARVWVRGEYAGGLFD